MKSLIASLSLAVLTGVTAVVPAQAVTYIPSVVASAYCVLRSRGFDHSSALSSAADQGVVAGNHWHYVYYGGVMMQSDIAQTTQLITRLCPQYLY